MSKKNSITILIVLLGIIFTGCEAKEENKEEISELVKSEVVEPVVEKTVLAEGVIPYDFPVLNTDAKDGEYILAPAREYLDDAIELGAEDAVFIFYVNKMIKTGEKESVINDINNLGEDVIMPNSLIISLPAGQTAEPGDVILTWWQSLAGMQRAMVVTGGTPTEPMVQYLDTGLEYDTEQILADSFVKLTDEFQTGTSVAVAEDGVFLDEQVLRVEGDKVLTLGWAGSLHIRNKADLKPVPIIPNIEVGDEVFVPIIDAYEPVTVEELDNEKGIVTVKYEWAGEMELEKYGYGSILKEL